MGCSGFCVFALLTVSTNAHAGPCDECHTKEATAMATSLHATVACEACHEQKPGTDHIANPNDAAQNPKIRFDSESCQNCHQDQYNSFFSDVKGKTTYGGGVEPVTLWPKTRDLPYWNALIDGHGFVIETYEERSMMWNQLDAQETLRPMSESCLTCHGTKVAYYMGITGLAGYGPGQTRTIENTQLIRSGNFELWQNPAIPYIVIPAGTTVTTTIDTLDLARPHQVESVVTLPDGRVYTSFSPYPGATATGDDPADPAKRTEARNYIWAALQALSLDGLEIVFDHDSKMHVGPNAGSANAAVLCNMCHDPHNTNLRLIQKSSLWSINEYGINPYSIIPPEPTEPGGTPIVTDFNAASRQDQIIAVCGQCHVEYVGGYSAVDHVNRHYFPFAKPSYPYLGDPASPPGLQEKYTDLFNYDQDWIHGIGIRPWQDTDPTLTGYAPPGSLNPIFETLSKTQHSEAETYWNSSMYIVGATCTDCHSKTVTKPDGTTYTSHSFISPVKLLIRGDNVCAQCHDPAAPMVGAPPFDQDTLLDMIRLFQDDVFMAQEDLQKFLIDAQAVIAAQPAGAARDANVALFKTAHLVWEYYANGENSMGFHNWDDAGADMGAALIKVGMILDPASTLGPPFGVMSEGAAAANPAEGVPNNLVDLLWVSTEVAAVNVVFNPDGTFTWDYNGLAFEVQRQVVNPDGTVGPWEIVSPPGGISAEPFIVPTEPDAPPEVMWADENNVQMDTTYNYRVRTIKGAEYSIWSQPTQIFTVETAGAPEFVQGATAGAENRLHWFAEPGNQTKFRIERATDPAFTDVTFWNVADSKAVPVRNWTDNTAAPDTTYYYRVRGEMPPDVPSPWSETVMITSEGTPPMPGNLAGFPLSPTEVQLTWWDLSGIESGFRLERADDPGFTTGLVTVNMAPNTLTSTDTGALEGNTYYYRIIANNVIGDSPANTAPVTVSGPSAPSGLATSFNTSNHLVLDWADNSNNEQGFRVERAEDSGFTTGIVSFNAWPNFTDHIDVTRTPGTDYWYRVVAYNGLGDSLPSDTACVLASDLNGDGAVGLWDFMIFRQNFGSTGLNLPGDFNGDGTVDLADLIFLRQKYGTACP